MAAITFTVTLHTVDLEALAEAGRKAAQDSFTHGEWLEYRDAYDGGPAGADLNELVATMFADAMPRGGYEFDTSRFHITEET